MSGSSPDRQDVVGVRVKIGELASRTGVSVRSLRYYEEQQLLLAERTSGGHRTFGADAVERVELIQLLFAAGVPSATVVTLLPCIFSGTTTPEMVAGLLHERDRIAAEARRLAATLARLDDVLASAEQRLAVPA